MYAMHKIAAIVIGAQIVAACSSGTGSNVPLSPAARPAGVTATPQYANGLLALYRFNGTLKDSSGNKHNAKDTGTPAYVTGAPFGGKAIAFDGTGGAIVTAPLDISVKTIPQLTMGGWFKATADSTPQYGIVSNDNGNYDRTIDIDNRDAKPGTYWSAFVGGKVVGNTKVALGQWVFEAVVYNQATLPGTYKLYVNDGTKTHVLHGASDFDDESITTAVTIGANPDFDHAFYGDAANVFFYVGALNAKQIGAIIANGPGSIP